MKIGMYSQFLHNGGFKATWSWKETFKGQNLADFLFFSFSFYFQSFSYLTSISAYSLVHIGCSVSFPINSYAFTMIASIRGDRPVSLTFTSFFRMMSSRLASPHLISLWSYRSWYLGNCLFHSRITTVLQTSLYAGRMAQCLLSNFWYGASSTLPPVSYLWKIYSR